MSYQETRFIYLEDTFGFSAEAGIPKPLKKSKHTFLSSDFPPA